MEENGQSEGERAEEGEQKGTYILSANLPVKFANAVHDYPSVAPNGIQRTGEKVARGDRQEDGIRKVFVAGELRGRMHR